MADVFLLIVGWLHAIAAVAWVGGGVFYWLVLRPAIRAGALPPQVSRFAAVEFGQLVILAMWTLVVTGAILLFTRLSEPTATLPYGVVLGVKIALSAWMFFLTLNHRGRARHASDQGSLRSAVNALGHVNMTVVLGIIVFLLSDILRMLVENELGR
jgi:putative copper export protein